MKYTIRHAICEDLPQILDLCRAVAGTPGCTWGDDYPALEDLQEDLDQDALYIICSGQNIIGCAGAAEYDDIDALPCWNSEITRPCGLARIGIHPAHQGQGLAGTLLTHIESEAKARGYDGLHFLVSPSNDTALALYQKHGYRHCGEGGLFGMDWFCYEKKL